RLVRERQFAYTAITQRSELMESGSAHHGAVRRHRVEVEPRECSILPNQQTGSHHRPLGCLRLKTTFPLYSPLRRPSSARVSRATRASGPASNPSNKRMNPKGSPLSRTSSSFHHAVIFDAHRDRARRSLLETDVSQPH